MVENYERLTARFPRLYAAASLKRAPGARGRAHAHRFSAALCRGLIEARAVQVLQATELTVFRGFMPRPH